MPFEQLGKVLRVPKQRTLIQKRLIDTAELLRDGDPELAFQHSILCQVSMPYREPYPEVRVWDYIQGHVFLRIRAGEVGLGPREWIPAPLPHGPKPRLILTHLNAEAMRTGSREVDVERSVTAFVKRLNLDPKGRNIREVMFQLICLSVADFHIGYVDGNEVTAIRVAIVHGLQVWLNEDRKPWPKTIQFSQEYFDSLTKHAVPLDERAIAALSHSAMALDIYAWLAQRLHRIPKPHRQLVPWVALKEQFGQGYDRVRAFREKFLVALRQVHVVYPAAKLDVNPKGLMLYTSPPPVAKTGVVVQLPTAPEPAEGAV